MSYRPRVNILNNKKEKKNLTQMDHKIRKIYVVEKKGDATEIHKSEAGVPQRNRGKVRVKEHA